MAKHSESKMDVTGVHLCCQDRLNAVDAAIMSAKGSATNTLISPFHQTRAPVRYKACLQRQRPLAGARFPGDRRISALGKSCNQRLEEA